MPKLKTTLTLLVSILLISGCSTSQEYAKDKKDGVYFTIPSNWAKISKSDLHAQELKSKATGAAERLALVSWQEAYSKGGEAKPQDVFSLKTPKSPLVYVRVRDLSLDEVQSVSYNSLRDIIVPLTSWIQKGNEAQNFALQNDSEGVQKAARGVRSTFSFVGSDGIDQTINQSAYISNDHSKLYVLLVRASTKDYLTFEKVLNKIADSFTIRGTK